MRVRLDSFEPRDHFGGVAATEAGVGVIRRVDWIRAERDDGEKRSRPGFDTAPSRP
jgi:hypothetical protein